MNTKSVHYPIAKDLTGNWISIASAQRGVLYYCPECKAPFVSRLGLKNVHHFAHKSGYQGICTGESGYHHLAKHLLAYHFENKGTISLHSKCSICRREFDEEKRITDIEVEKGSDDYRPDARLYIEEGKSIECEIVYKNPLGDKFENYKDRNANLLVWEIDEEVKTVPDLMQWLWEDEYEWGFKFNDHKIKNRLFLIASPITPKHDCTPYGISYVFEIDCWACHHPTKVALLSDWHPRWGDESKIGKTWSSIEYYTNIPANMVPIGLIGNLNKRVGTNLKNDYSKTANSSYLMNHCEKCHAKIGDWHLGEHLRDSLIEGDYPVKVNVDFELTPWERTAIAEFPYKQSIRL